MTFIGDVERGHFRLHPAGYKGISEGCITLPRLSDFMLLRDVLLNTPALQVTATLTAFGTIQVY
ncbi:TPA: tlde1 domain-containing protein [Raoultella planticola]